MNIFVFGSSIVSSYWNGAATYYRGIYKHLADRGHDITFAEPDAYGRQSHRDDGDYSWVRSLVYTPHTDVDRMLEHASKADVVIKHSGVGADDTLLETRVPDLGKRCVTVFWDVDAPATLARLRVDSSDAFHADIGRYDAVFTYGGGPGVRDEYISRGARSYSSIYNGLDPATHHPVPADPAFSCDLAFIGNRLPDREARVEELFLKAALLAPDKHFLLGGEGWADKPLPPNVRWIGHVGTGDHNRINSSAAMVININRSSMAECGFSPPTRVFEAAGAGACMLCDNWPGIEHFFAPEKELIVIHSAQDVSDALCRYGKKERKAVGEAFRSRALRDHTYAQRAVETEAALTQCLSRRAATIPAPEQVEEHA